MAAGEAVVFRETSVLWQVPRQLVTVVFRSYRPEMTDKGDGLAAPQIFEQPVNMVNIITDDAPLSLPDVGVREARRMERGEGSGRKIGKGRRLEGGKMKRVNKDTEIQRKKA